MPTMDEHNLTFPSVSTDTVQTFSTICAPCRVCGHCATAPIIDYSIL